MGICPTCGRDWPGKPKGTDYSEVIDRLMMEWNFSLLKATTSYDRLQYTSKDLDAWADFARTKGKRLACHLMKVHRNPSEVKDERTTLNDQAILEVLHDDVDRQ